MDWAAFQACLNERHQADRVVKDEETIEECVEELTNAIPDDTLAFAPKRRTRANPPLLYPLEFKMKCA
jgi:hypothetical protein